MVEPVDHWPAGARVLGGVVQDGVAYVLLESQRLLDQPAGLRGVWIDAGTLRSPFEASPMALADVRDASDLASRVAHPPPVGSSDRSAVALLATLRAASASTSSLARALAAEGADVEVAWQSTFVQPVGKLDGEGAAPSPLADRVLADVRAAVTTQACGADACEAWTDAGHAVVRFVVQGGRWVVRTVVEDAPLPRTTPGATPREVEPSPSSSATESTLRSRAREVKAVLGEAPLTSAGGTIGVGITDLAPDAPVVAISEGGSARVFALDVGTVHADTTETRWAAAFADVDGDGRTDVVVRMSGKRVDGAPLAWTQIYLAPPPSVQAISLEADLPSALVVMDSGDARAAAHAAVAVPARAVARDDACRLLIAASTPAGFRRVASADARVLLFDEPAMPTWRPKVVPASKVAADDVRGLGAHCAELTCSATRSYCAWTGGADSQHFWFGWRDGQLALLGAADYQGE
ncbi:MAG TPA: VCBS repeat-containing protein [Polyangiaceae bacterium]